jgi:hypothetical protein
MPQTNKIVVFMDAVISPDRMALRFDLRSRVKPLVYDPTSPHRAALSGVHYTLRWLRKLGNDSSGITLLVDEDVREATETWMHEHQLLSLTGIDESCVYFYQKSTVRQTCEFLMATHVIISNLALGQKISNAEVLVLDPTFPNHQLRKEGRVQKIQSWGCVQRILLP